MDKTVKVIVTLIIAVLGMTFGIIGLVAIKLFSGDL